MSFAEMEEISLELASSIDGANALQEQPDCGVELSERVLQPFLLSSVKHLQHLKKAICCARRVYEDMAKLFSAQSYDASLAVELLVLINKFCRELTRNSKAHGPPAIRRLSCRRRATT
jgi:hypothetical protein